MADTLSVPNGWRYLKAREVFESISDKSHNGELQVLSATQDRGIVPRTAMDIDISYDKNSLPTYKRVMPGNFVIHLRSFQGGLAYSEVEGIISPAYVILRPKGEICDGYYKYLFQSGDYIKRLNVAVYGIRDGKQISYESFGMIRIPVPPLSEQRRIAEILATQDSVIKQKLKLIDAKKKQKHWLMQNLVTGKARLLGFCDKWERVKLRDVGKWRKGRGISKEEASSGSIPAIRYGELYTVHHEYVKQFYSFISESIAQYSVKLSPGDVLFTCSGETRDEIGKSVTFIDNCIAFAGGDLVILSPNAAYLPKYLGFALNTLPVNKQKARLGQGDSIVHISTESLKKIALDLPPFSEQTAIAEMMVTADREIELLKKELEQQKLFKKYLMQQLLTGKTQVNNVNSESEVKADDE